MNTRSAEQVSGYWPGVPLHSWGATALFGTPPAWQGAAMASQALALAAAQLLSSRETLSRAQNELTTRLAAATPPPEQADEVSLGLSPVTG